MLLDYVEKRVEDLRNLAKKIIDEQVRANAIMECYATHLGLLGESKKL